MRWLLSREVDEETRAVSTKDKMGELQGQKGLTGPSKTVQEKGIPLLDKTD